MGKRKSREEPEALPMVDGAEDNPTDMFLEPTPKKTKKDKREKKEKKEKKEKPKKRKHHEEPDALPDADIAEDETPVSVANEPTRKKDKKDRKQKSKKRRINEEGDAVEVDEIGKTEEDVTDEESKEPKLSKKAKWRAARRKRAEGAENGDGDDGGDAEGDIEGEEGPDEGAEGKKTKKQRFLLFIGNLPYTATAEDVERHFAKVKPQRVRLLTTKSEDGSKDTSRGCAFVELDSARMMDKALLRMHHSEFDDGKSEKRKINVEVTAGGGGSNPARMEKIKAKNAKLDEERARKAQKAADLKEAEKDNKEKNARAEDDATNEGGPENLKVQEEKGKEDEQDDTAGVHPSRLAQMSSNYQDRSWEGREDGDRRGGFKGGRGGRGGGRGFGRGRGRGRGRGGGFRSGRGGRRGGGGGGFRGAA